jgi:hypothetical protein
VTFAVLTLNPLATVPDEEILSILLKTNVAELPTVFFLLDDGQSEIVGFGFNGLTRGMEGALASKTVVPGLVAFLKKVGPFHFRGTIRGTIRNSFSSR